MSPSNLGEQIKEKSNQSSTCFDVLQVEAIQKLQIYLKESVVFRPGPFASDR